MQCNAGNIRPSDKRRTANRKSVADQLDQRGHTQQACVVSTVHDHKHTGPASFDLRSDKRRLHQLNIFELPRLLNDLRPSQRRGIVPGQKWRWQS